MPKLPVLFKSATIYGHSGGELFSVEHVRGEHLLLEYGRKRLRLRLRKPPAPNTPLDAYRLKLYESGREPVPAGAVSFLQPRFPDLVRERFLPADWGGVETAFFVETEFQRHDCGHPLLRGASRETGAWVPVSRLWGAIWPHEHLIVAERV